MLEKLELKRRGRAAGIHLLISAAVALTAAPLLFGLWYPGSFRLLAGGRDLFVLIVSVDVVLGPFLTLAVFNVRKEPKHLRLDLGVIVLLQTAALTYGMHTVYIARPVAMVFEVDRFRLVTARDVSIAELPQALPNYRDLTWRGPWLLGTRAPADAAERKDALFKGLNGLDISSRPQFWQPYTASIPAALAQSRPVTDILAHYRASADGLRNELAEMNADESTARFLPVVARGDWVAVLDQRGAVLGYLPLDGFF